MQHSARSQNKKELKFEAPLLGDKRQEETTVFCRLPAIFKEKINNLEHFDFCR